MASFSPASTSASVASTSYPYNQMHAHPPPTPQQSHPHSQPEASVYPTTTANTNLAPSAGQVAVTPALLQSMRPSKIYAESIERGRSVTSVCFDDRGDVLLTSANDETLQIWSCKSGTHLNKIYSRKYGVHLARFTHRASNVIYASTKEDDTLRYMNLQDNKYLQYFRGHKGRVTSLEMSPVDDTFISAAVNDSVRLWDLRTPHCQAFLRIQGHPVAAYDPTGKVVAMAINERSSVLLYDVKRLTAPPFVCITIDDSAYLSMLSMPPRVPLVTSLSFSPDGSLLLLGTAGDVHYVAHSFEGHVMYRLQGHVGLERDAADGDASTTTTTGGSTAGLMGMVPEAGASGAECCWTPDGRFVVSGTHTGRLLVWQIPPESQWPPPPGQGESGISNNPHPLSPSSAPASAGGGGGGGGGIEALDASVVLDGHVGGCARAVAFHPRAALMVSAAQAVTLWLPS